MAPPELTNAWLAEHVLGWHLPRLTPAPLMILRWWTDAEGKPLQAPETFDPLHVPADALRVLVWLASGLIKEWWEVRYQRQRFLQLLTR
jgi:hypothetical protein